MFQRPVPKRGRWLDNIGWWWSLIALVPVVVILGIGFLTRNPSLSPAPEGYSDAACSTIAELNAALDNLTEAEALQESDEQREALAHEAEDRLTDAYVELRALPVWSPGSQLERQIGGLSANVETAIAVLLGRAAAGDQRDPSPSIDLAESVQGDIQRSLDNREYGFDCS